MNKNRLLDYESPVTELIELRVESGILYVSGGGNINNATEEDFGDF